MNPRIIEMAVVTGTFMGAGIFWTWLQVRNFDRKCGHIYWSDPNG